MIGRVVAKSDAGKNYVVEYDNWYVGLSILDSHTLGLHAEVRGYCLQLGDEILEDHLGQRFKAKVSMVSKVEEDALKWMNN